MDFELNDEQRELQRTVREFATHEIAPHVMEWDEGQLWPGEVLRQLGAMGLLGMLVPAEYGGSGLGYIEYALAIAELARVDGSIGLIVAAHNSLCTNHILLFGSEAQKAKYLPKLARGEWIGCWSLTEPEAGSDAGGTRTTAVRSGDGWRINGAKTFTTNGNHAQVCVAMAVTHRERNKHGISAFVVEAGTPGFRPGKKENKLGMRASDTSEIVFDECQVGADGLLGEEGAGFVDAMQVLDGGRISIAALGLGMAQGAYDAARRYAKQRKQFGRAIAEFQAIQWKLADMATEIEAARLLTLSAAWQKDQGQTVTRASAMAKLYAGEVAVRAANECVQIHGGYGFIKDYPAEKFYRDVKLCTIGEGTSEIQRLVIARELLKD
ncbi:MAG TPA: acyl-CoA dehydrogenase family protein [Terriglobales bacterium]|nr:acyl-CoA dehydrogenase family protein [Terriglobales bacterium]